MVGLLILLIFLLPTQSYSVGLGAQVSTPHAEPTSLGELLHVRSGLGPSTAPPPPPPPPPNPEPNPKLPPDYQPPPMTEEWQIQEFNWESWYWMNLANDYLNHRLNAVQEEILINQVQQSIANNPNFQNAEHAIIYAMAQNLDPQHYFSTQHALGVVMR